jgi:tetratricopeptide (TPR) repeat protein
LIRLRRFDNVIHQALVSACDQPGGRALAEAALREAVSVNPDAAEPHFVTGAIHARFGEWSEAAASYGRGLKLDPANHYSWYQSAALCLAVGDVEGYRGICREMLAQFEEQAAENLEIAERTAKACSLVTGAVEDYSRVERMAQRIVSGTETHRYYGYFILTKGLSDYRAERHKEAVEWLRRFAPKADRTHVDATALAVLAMAQHGLGRTAESKQALDQAKNLLAAKMPDPAKGRLFGAVDFHDWLHAQVLVREAEQTVAK